MALIFHVSDLHFGAEDGAALAWFAHEVAAHKPDAIVLTGDLTMRARRREFAAAQAWLETLAPPVSIEVGNHDLPYFNPYARFLHPYGRYAGLESRIERHLDLPGVDVIPLRTTARFQWRFNWSKGHVTNERIALAAAEVKRSTGPVRLVACHHPLIDPGTRGSARTRNGRQALALLAQAGASAILSGHVHDPYDQHVAIDGTPLRLIGAGTLSERVRDTKPSYNAITTGPHGLDVDMRFAN